MSVSVKEVEKQLLDEISLDVPKQILNKFSTLVRESGSEDERIAFNFLADFLKEWGVPHQVHHPNIYLSVPKKAAVKLTSPEYKEFKAKTPSFAVSTGDDLGSGEVVYIASGHARSLDKLFDANLSQEVGNLEGKVVLTEGYPMPGKVAAFNETGVAAAIFISPGKNIHDGICTSIWGSPDLDSIDNEPKIPVLAISKPDGEELKELAQKGKVEVEFQTQHEKGWFNCPLIDIFIEGTEEPEKYVLLHGHLDSWTVGIGDNATGDASLIEMARIFHKHRDKLKRSVRIAIWPGHSTGRYAGSTWFADQFALDLEENCVAQVNCDSPGCRWATSYDYMTWFSEVDDFCKEVIKDAVNQDSKGKRPNRAGDYSFNNIGITSFYMLSSSIPEEILDEKGYYPVGGCGANIEWHTEDDLMHVADYEILEKDLRVYLTSVFRVLNEPVHPFNFVSTTEEFISTISSYQGDAGSHFNFAAALQEVNQLREELAAFYDYVNTLEGLNLTDLRVKEVNEKILELGRILVTINFSRKGKFRHDPALEVLPLPDIAPAKDLSNLQVGSHRYNVTVNHLVRGQNRLIGALRQARKVVAGR
jgi:N-acetylated-alpha-linked acidic dipeptidase